jgi:hypothetical protein
VIDRLDPGRGVGEAVADRKRRGVIVAFEIQCDMGEKTFLAGSLVTY